MARPGLENGFDGIDWDIEGNDDMRFVFCFTIIDVLPQAMIFVFLESLSSPYNEFTVACLDLMGRLSQLAQRDGYVVSMVPPESYLDPMAAPTFNRSLKFPYDDQPQHADFLYHGRNAYALPLVKFGQTLLLDGSTVPTFDFISIQLYETWSHADYNITGVLPMSQHQHQRAAEYLVDWVPRVVNGWYLDFASDPSAGVPSQMVNVPDDRLVIGLANGWAGTPRTILIMPDEAAEVRDFASTSLESSS